MDLRLPPTTMPAAIRPPALQRPASETAVAGTGGGFTGAMKSALHEVSAAQNQSRQMQREVQMENPTVSLEDTMVAIVSLGATRQLMLRPRGGGTSLKFTLAHGDLVVMGGSCQRTWEHAIPKSTRAIGPRISVQFRPRGVR